MKNLTILTKLLVKYFTQGLKLRLLKIEGSW